MQFCLFLYAVGCFAQASVKGVITEQNSGNKPIMGVQIKALGASPEATDNAGMFNLVFSNKKAGDRIIISKIEKPGYEIVNKREVENWIIASAADNRTKIIMCPDGQIATNTAKYYDISLEAVTNGYNKKVKELQKQLAEAKIDAKTFGELAQEMGKKFNEQQNQLEELADKFARENFDDCSAIQQKAFSAFKNGDIDGAIAILEGLNSEAEIAKAHYQLQKSNNMAEEAQRMKIQADSMIQQNIAKLMFQARLYVANFQFDEASKSLEMAVMADTLQVDNLIDYANFLRNQQQYQKAMVFFNIAYRQSNLLDNKIKIKLQMGELLIAQNRFKEAEEALLFAMDKNEEFRGQSINYDWNRVEILATLATNYTSMYELTKSDSLFSLVLKTFEGLLEEDRSDAVCYKWMTVLNNYAILKRALLDGNGYMNNTRRSLDICNRLRGGRGYENQLSINYGNMGTAFSDMGMLDSSLFYYNKEMAILKKMAALNRQRHIPDLACNYLNTAICLFFLGKVDSAIYLAQQCVAIRDSLAFVDPYTYNPLLGITYNNLGYFYYTKGNSDMAVKQYIRAKDIYVQLANIYPKVYNVELARIEQNLGDTYYANKLYEMAETEYEKAMQICANLPVNQAIQFETFRVSDSRNIAFVRLLQKRYSDASIQIGNALAFKKSPDYESKAQEYAKIVALPYDLEGLSLKSIKAHALLLQGEYGRAESIYMEIMNRPDFRNPDQHFAAQIRTEILELIKNGVTHNDFERVLKLLDLTK